MTRNTGFTLVELMIAVAILSILMAVALPAYRNYVNTAEEGALVTNIESMTIFQEDFFLRNGNYAAPLADLAAINTAIGWQPRTNDGITYVVADTGGNTYSVTATSAAGDTVCIVFPAKDRC